jgi:hypothetical protein
LPGIEHQLEGATSDRIFLPVTPVSDWLRLIGSSLLVQRTNLLSPSVALLPVFKVTLIAATNTNLARAFKDRQQFFSRKIFHRISVPEDERYGSTIRRNSFQCRKLSICELQKSRSQTA